MLEALLAGVARPASELAALAGVSRSTASEHLARLQSAGLVDATSSGRHRYFALAGPDVAAALEALGLISAPRAPATLGRSLQRRAEREGRTCYDHLAGVVGVAITDALVARGALTAGSLSLRDRSVFAELSIDVEALSPTRPTTRACLDWSERRPHLAGALGAALCARLLEEGSIERLPPGRAVRVTAAGARRLEAALGSYATNVATISPIAASA
jgi:DNA-binding transcriptional ArsR family regulator